MFSSGITFAGAVLFTSLFQVLPVAAVPTVEVTDRDSPIPGYGIEELVWAVQTTPGSATVNVTGTVQDVIQYAEKVNPDFRSDFGLDQQKSPTYDQTLVDIESIHCDWTPYVSSVAIADGISDLLGASGKPTIGPGPRKCARVSCHSAAESGAIYWCNDNAETSQLDKWKYIGEAAQRLMSDCQEGWFVRGQIFMKDHWNVILRREDC